MVSKIFEKLNNVRRRLFIAPLCTAIKKKLPPISPTEREAIEAGHTWWEKELFNGHPNWEKLFANPAPQLTEKEQSFLDQQVETLCSMLDDWQILTHLRDLPPEVWDYLKKEKFFGLVVPVEYGGLGFSALAHSTIVSKIASRSISTAVNAMVPNSLGPAELLLHYGTEEQKSRFLPALAKGEEIPCFALTALDAGSDAGALTDTGLICRDIHEGKEIIGIRLNWDKRYITLAPIATLLGVAVHLYDPEHLLGDRPDLGITLCLIPATHPGVELGRRHYPLFQAFMNGPTRGKDVFIPLDWIIGGRDMAGKGWRMLMECLSIGRSISLPALATASAKVIYRFTGAYARLRRQFDTPLSSFEGIEERLSFIAGNLYLMEAARTMTAAAVDLHIKPATASAIIKYHLTELSKQITSHAMDIHAGHMIQVGPRNFLANAYIANPISITVEGANILTRNLIIFGQGAIRCHPYLLKEIELLSSPTPDLAAFEKVFFSHVGRYLFSILKNIFYGLTGGRFIFASSKNKTLKPYQRQLTRMSAALAWTADTCLILLGGKLKRSERISARLGDILSQLYLASSVLKYFHDHNKEDKKGEKTADIDYVRWASDQCLHKIQIAFNELFHNFPSRWLGCLLSWVIFPFGNAYRSPCDQLSGLLMNSMLTPSELRERLTQHCYIGKKEEELSVRLEKAFSLIATIEPLWKKLNKEVKTGLIPRYYTFTERLDFAQTQGTLTTKEVKLLKEFESLRQEILKVNEFSFNLNTVIA